MKILMFGRGVIATQYAWALEEAGHTVEFYIRPGRKDEYGSAVTLNILDARKKMKGVSVQKEWKITTLEYFNADHNYDLIIVSVQHYQFKKVAAFLCDKVGGATLLIFNNFWEEPLEQAGKLPTDRLVWSFPRAGGGFDHKGVLNGTLWGSITIGTFGTAPTERTVAVINLFKSAGFKCKITNDFRSWLLGHFAMNAAMHLENLKYPTNNSSFVLDVLQTTKYWKNVMANGRELLPLLHARKVDLNNSPDWKMFRLPPWIMSLIMKIVIRYIPSVRMVFTGHTNQNELRSYCADVLAKAEELNIELPQYRKYAALFEPRS